MAITGRRKFVSDFPLRGKKEEGIGIRLNPVTGSTKLYTGIGAIASNRRPTRGANANDYADEPWEIRRSKIHPVVGCIPRYSIWTIVFSVLKALG